MNPPVLSLAVARRPGRFLGAAIFLHVEIESGQSRQRLVLFRLGNWFSASLLLQLFQHFFVFVDHVQSRPFDGASVASGHAHSLATTLLLTPGLLATSFLLLSFLGWLGAIVIVGPRRISSPPLAAGTPVSGVSPAPLLSPSPPTLAVHAQRALAQRFQHFLPTSLAASSARWRGWRSRTPTASISPPSPFVAPAAVSRLTPAPAFFGVSAALSGALAPGR